MEILSRMWSLLCLLTVLQNLLPPQLLSLLRSLSDTLHHLLTPYSYFDVPEFNGHSTAAAGTNLLYRHISLYLNSLSHASSSTCRRLTLHRPPSTSTHISFSVAPNHTAHDTFMGHRLSWTHRVETVDASPEVKRCFTLRVPKRHRRRLLPMYLDRITEKAEEFERASRRRRLFTNDNGPVPEWVPVPFNHPATFETLALEPELRNQLAEGLTAFSQGKEFYHRIGQAWKRSYLLYGPPGAGKSSLIAAMSNFLSYDVYDLDLTRVLDYFGLRALLMRTTSRSIIVIEDIDQTAGRAVEGDGRVTLSELLKFTDGLWSCCGEERIVVFTATCRNSVAPALVRTGRIDVDVSLGACGVHAFRAMVKNYLGVESHVLFDVAESCIRSGGALMPAQIGEILLRNRNDADVAIQAVTSALQASILCGAVAEEVEGGREYDDPSSSQTSLEESLEKWSPEKVGGKRKKEGSTWEKKVKLFGRFKSLTKSDSGRRGV